MSRTAIEDTKPWPPLKKALWDVVMKAKINARYVAAFPFVEELYAAALATGEVSEQHSAEPVGEPTERALKSAYDAGWNDHALLSHPPVTAGWEKAVPALILMVDAFLSRHGCFPNDKTTDDERIWNRAMAAAYEVVGQPNTKSRERKLASLSTPPQAVTEVTMKVLDDAYTWYSSTNHGSLDGIPFEHVAHVIDVMRLRVKSALTEGVK